MTLPSSQRANEILRAALALPPEQREPYIALRCGGDAHLREQVSAALAAQLAATLAGDPPSDAAPASSSEPDPATLSRATTTDLLSSVEPPLRRLGRYRILRLLGEGGMGVVYLAQQEHPQRLVALKVIRGGTLSPRALRRFELESQVLARLQHPGIAQVYEAGTAAETGAGGRPGTGQLPFFAMEYVQGTSLTDYANNHHLDTRQRLELFARVCDAVHHAHQKGVVHRDLKPGNILVDAQGQPKVLDFGVARTLDADGNGNAVQASMHTDAGQLLGTVPYMSPEQVSASGADNRDVDTRSDVYTLGVILFELLVGRLPHDISTAAVPETVRAIAEEEAPRLSSLDRSLRGDVETIARKALEKDRNRRYQSASELAEDIRRHLRDEPIAARPPSRSYQLGKFAKRNKGLVAGVVAAFVILIAGAVATSILAVVAGKNAENARKQADIAKANETRAEQAAADAIAVTEFLQNMLASANPDGDDLDRDGGSVYIAQATTVRQVLDRADAGIAALDDRPQVQIPLLNIVARSYRSLGELDKARHAAALCAQKTKALFGEDSYQAMSADSLLGSVLLEQNKLPEAEAIARRSLAWLEANPSHPSATEVELAKARSELARIHFESGRAKDALPLARSAFADLVRLKGSTFPAAMQAGDVLSTVLSSLGDFVEAERVVRGNLAARETAYGKGSLSAAYTMTTLANALQKQGKNDEAIATLKRVLEIRRAALAPDHPRLQLTIVNLGIAYVGAGRQAEGLPLLQEAFEATKAKLGESHPRSLSAMGNVAYCLEDLGRLDEAERLFRRSVEIGREEIAKQGQTIDNNDFCIRLSNLGALQLKAGKFKEAEEAFAEATAIAAQRLPADHYYLAIFKNNRGRALACQNEFAKAESLLLESHAVLQKQFGKDHVRTHRSAWRLAELYDAWSKPEQAKPWRAMIPGGYRDDR